MFSTYNAICFFLSISKGKKRLFRGIRDSYFIIFDRKEFKRILPQNEEEPCSSFAAPVRQMGAWG
jgi:hypothetical protein